MNRARLHHYLPAAYLAGFCDPAAAHRGENIVWVYEAGKPIRAASPWKEARQRDLYAVEGEGLVGDEAEQHLSVVESRAIAVIRDIRIGERLFTPEERQALAAFMGLMFTRTPGALRYAHNVARPASHKVLRDIAADPARFAEMWNSLGLAADGVDDKEEARQKILSGCHERLSFPNEDIVAMFSTAQMATEEMLRLKWKVVRTSKHASFITCDFPIVGGQRQGNELALGVGPSTPNSEFYFPLSRGLCLCMAADSDEGHGYLRPMGVRMMNQMLMQYAQRRIYASVRLERVQRDFERLFGSIRLGENALGPMLDGKQVL
jgi:hypothetical protein